MRNFWNYSFIILCFLRLQISNDHPQLVVSYYHQHNEWEIPPFLQKFSEYNIVILLDKKMRKGKASSGSYDESKMHRTSNGGTHRVASSCLAASWKEVALHHNAFVLLIPTTL